MDDRRQRRGSTIWQGAFIGGHTIPLEPQRSLQVRNEEQGCGGVDKMSCEQLLPWLRANKDTRISSLMDGSYRPNPVRLVEIPKDNGKKRLLGIPTVADRMVQQAINQILTPIYEKQSSKKQGTTNSLLHIPPYRPFPDIRSSPRCHIQSLRQLPNRIYYTSA